MRRVKRLKEAIARLERESAATEEEVEAAYDRGYIQGSADNRGQFDLKLRDLIAEISLQAAFTGTDLADLPGHVNNMRLDYQRALLANAQLTEEIARLRGEQ